jgi:tRNA A-37 threonylcarbamoyl transferase component Bud32
MENEISRTLRDDSHRVYISTHEMLIPYRPFAELENWLRYRMEDKSVHKKNFARLMVVGFMVMGGPIFVLKVLQWLLAYFAVGGSAAAAAAATAETISIVTYFYSMMAALMAAAAAIYYTRPTHISLSERGLKYIFDHKISGRPLYRIEGKLIPWEHVSRIHMMQPIGKMSQDQQLLSMMAGSVSLINLRMGAFLSPEDRAHVLEGIEKWAPRIARDAEVIQALEPPADHSYTEMWMKALSAPPKREKLKPLMQGARLKEGRFEIEGPLGVGGQGTAYLAYDIAADRSKVVLKEFILPVYVDLLVRKQALDRFEREAKILKQLNHDQIVKLVDFFVEDHRAYLVLEHIDGSSLRQLVERQGALPEAQVQSLAMQMCEILKYLHGLTPPVVHRDFTPDNLILRTDGTLKLVDFNVAQKTESTATGTVVGKQAYLPPEQFRGMPNTQSDIYAMGATLYYLLAGRDPEPISQSDPKSEGIVVSDNLNEVIRQCTAIDLALRHANAQEVRDQLTGSLSGSPVP